MRPIFSKNYESRNFERRYHATWLFTRGLSPLAQLASWLCQHRPRLLADAPRPMLTRAAADVAARLPLVAAREPTRRHRRHFAWLLRWHCLLASELRRGGAA